MWAEPRAELIRRWQAGDPIAFTELVRDWEGPIAPSRRATRAR
jgi:hypothetical protein